MSRCPDEDTLAAFLDGALSPAQEDRIHAHFDVCATCRRVVAGIGRQVSLRASATMGMPELPPMPKPGTHVGRFVVADVLGRGGMGIVLRATDPELGRAIAIKIHAPSGRATFSSADQQLAEARALARLSHPNVVEIYDVGLHDGAVYIAMELIDGPSLAEWVRARQPPLGTRLDKLMELGEALAAVHAAGLVHRDVKPSNAVIAPDGGLRLLDFGLASEDTLDASTEQVGLQPAASTPAGFAVGTPLYMPPEQHSGAIVDGHADQFAFCVSAFEVLHGYRPFSGRSIEALVARMQSGTIEHRKGCGVPRRIEAVLRRGLRPDPARRFASMEHLLATLRRARSPRRWLWVGATGIVAGSATLAATGADAHADRCGELQPYAWPEHRAPLQAAFANSGLPDANERWVRVAAALDDYAEDLQSTETLACAAEAPGSAVRLCLQTRRAALAGLVDALLTSGPDALRNADKAITALPLPEACRRGSTEVTDAGDPELQRHRATLAEASAMISLGRHQEALELADSVFAATRRSPNGPLTAEIELRRGVALRKLLRWEDARRALTAAYFAGRRHGRTTIAIAAGLETATLLASDLQDPEAGVRWLDHVMAGFPDAVQRDPKWVASIEDTRGQILFQLGRLRAAETGFRAAVEAVSAAPEVNDDDRSVYISHLAVALQRRGEPEQALELHRRALALQVDYFGEDHLNVLHSRIAIASTLQGLDRFDEARQEYERGLAVGRRTVPEHHPIMAFAWNNLASLELEQRRAAAAVEAADRALHAYRTAFGDTHPYVAIALHTKGEGLRLQGDFAGAAACQREALMLLGTGERDPAGYASAMAALGLAQWLGGDLSAASRSMHGALERMEATQHEALRQTALLLCLLSLDRADREDADAICPRAANLAASADLDPDDEARHQRADAWHAVVEGTSPTPAWPVLEHPDAIDARVDEAFRRDLDAS